MKNIFRILNVCTIVSGAALSGLYAMQGGSGSITLKSDISEDVKTQQPMDVQESNNLNKTPGHEIATGQKDEERVMTKKEYEERVDDILVPFLERIRDSKIEEFRDKILAEIEKMIYEQHKVYDVPTNQELRLDKSVWETFAMNESGKLGGNGNRKVCEKEFDVIKFVTSGLLKWKDESEAKTGRKIRGFYKRWRERKYGKDWRWTVKNQPAPGSQNLMK